MIPVMPRTLIDSTSEKHVMITVDADWLATGFSNLIENALNSHRLEESPGWHLLKTDG
jgi:hypothetical protein